MEIGSIYEINPQTAADADAYNVLDFTLEEVKKFDKSYCAFTASGREAIALSLKAIEKNRPDIKKVCLLPAYMCDSVFWPFERAGWQIHFYHIKKNLKADKENLYTQIELHKPGLLFIHSYYGMDTWNFLRPALKTWQAQGICIMEDVTQAYYLKDSSWEADYIVGSLRKWYPIPDGGFTVSDSPFPKEPLLENKIFTNARLKLLSEKWGYLHNTASPEEKKVLKASFLQENRSTEEWLDRYRGISSLSKESMKILSGLSETACAGKRNANYHYLHDKLRNQTCFTPVFTEESVPDACTAPLYFPIYAQNRDDLQRFLGNRGIYAPILWPVGKENADCLTKEEKEIYDQILALPIDQRYGLPEMQHMAETLFAYEQVKCGCPDPSCPPGQAKSSTARHAASDDIIAIRADANEIIATGHIMRCITIARCLQKRGKKILFFTADEYPKAMLDQAGMDYVCLHTPWNRMDEEVQILSSELQKHGCSKLLADSYQVTEKYFGSLKNVCKTIYIDDCFTSIYPVDMVINYNAYHVRFPYEKVYKGRAKLLLGTAYVPLREEFQRKELSAHSAPGTKTPATASHILISSGGGDIYNALCGILSEAIKNEKLAHNIFHVIVGSFNKNIEALEQLAQSHPNIHLHYNVTNMAELMKQCHIAVSAAGTMLFELCAVQVPAVFYVCADNQQYDSDFFASENRMLFSGDIRQNREVCIDNILKNMEMLLSDCEMQRQMKLKLHEVTDGKGADRIAEEIITL